MSSFKRKMQRQIQKNNGTLLHKKVVARKMGCKSVEEYNRRMARREKNLKEIEKLEKSVPVSRNKDGYDIISNAGDRLTEYKKRCEVKGLIGIPTGIPKLDEITNGWLWGEDLVVLTGRTNVGKTWIGEYFATMAWNMGYKILMYSGEMSTAMVGFRFDTLNKHFSNMGLLNGSGTLGKKPDTDGAK